MEQQVYPRLLPIEKAYNVRDLGGYLTTEGKHVKWRRVIRSGDLYELSDNDLKYFESIGLKTYIDFRSKQEKTAAPDKNVATLTESVWLPITPGDISTAMFSVTPENIPSIMEEVYADIIRWYQEEYKEFFRLLALEGKAPLLFHCSAGKDRTGIGAALFLSALGVNRETIMNDYLLSAEYMKGKYDKILQKYPQFEPLTTVRPEYLQKVFDIIDHEYGGMDNFLVNHLEANPEKMKELYTE